MTEYPPPSNPDETPEERVARNWNEILQELRVIQAGSQIITGFLLAAAFQPRFTELDPAAYVVYFALLGTAVVTTIVGLTPVMLHRRLFRAGAKELLVRLADQLATVALVGVGVTLAGIVLLIVEMAAGPWAAVVATASVLIVIAILWVILPGRVRRRLGREQSRENRAAANERAER